MEKFEMFQVFNCYDMPEDVKKSFFDYSNASNDCYVDKHVYEDNNHYTEEQLEDGVEYINKEDYYYKRGEDILSDWLYDNGAEVWEKVIIKDTW